MLGLLVVLAGGAAGGWWLWHRRPAPAVDVPLPAGVEDDEVRLTLERARQEVLDRPRSADAWGEYGLTLFANLFPQEADRCFAEAARLDPDNGLWPYARGVIALKLRPREAVALLRQAARRPGQAHESAACLLLAEALLEDGQRDEAERLFRREWESHPDARAGYGLGLALLAAGDDAGAADLFAAVRDDPHTRKKATAQLAALARGRGDAKAAADLERRAAGLPDDEGWDEPLAAETFRRRVGRRRLEREIAELEGARPPRWEEAAALYEAELERRPTVWAAVGAGTNRARAGQLDRAVALLRQAVTLDPNSSEARHSLAVVLLLRAKHEPGAADVKGWLREAADQARRAAELKPDFAYAYLRWGLALGRLGEKAAALAPLRKAVECRPEDPELQLALGEALLDADRLKEAEEHLENARRLMPDDRRPVEALERLRKKGG
jgi:tetratricopeptide (TPR) repeat protein